MVFSWGGNDLRHLCQSCVFEFPGFAYFTIDLIFLPSTNHQSQFDLGLVYFTIFENRLLK